MSLTIVQFLAELDKAVPDRQFYTDVNSIRQYIRRGSLKGTITQLPGIKRVRYEIPESEATRIIEALTHTHKEN